MFLILCMEFIFGLLHIFSDTTRCNSFFDILIIFQCKRQFYELHLNIIVFLWLRNLNLEHISTNRTI